MTPPHIAAGINLSFWPFGPIARAGGGFFIRRKVKGDRIYTAVLRAYVKHLLQGRLPAGVLRRGGTQPDREAARAEDRARLDGGRRVARRRRRRRPLRPGLDRLRAAHRGGELRARAGGRARRGRRACAASSASSQSSSGATSGSTCSSSRRSPLAAVARERLGDRATSLAVDDAWSGEAGEPTEAGARAVEGPEAKRRLVQARDEQDRVGHRAGHHRDARRARRHRAARRRGARDAGRGDHAAASSCSATSPRRTARASRVGSRGRPAIRARRVRSPTPSAGWRRSGSCGPIARRGGAGVAGGAGAAAATSTSTATPSCTATWRSAIVAAAVLARRTTPEDAWGAFERAGWISRLLKLEFMYQPGTSAEEAFESLVALLERLGGIERASGALRPGPSPEILHFLAELAPALPRGLPARGRDGARAARPGAAAPSLHAPAARRRRHRARPAGAGAPAGSAAPEAVSKATVENAVGVADPRALPAGKPRRRAQRAGWTRRHCARS